MPNISLGVRCTHSLRNNWTLSAGLLTDHALSTLNYTTLSSMSQIKKTANTTDQQLTPLPCKLSGRLTCYLMPLTVTSQRQTATEGDSP